MPVVPLVGDLEDAMDALGERMTESKIHYCPEAWRLYDRWVVACDFPGNAETDPLNGWAAFREHVDKCPECRVQVPS